MLYTIHHLLLLSPQVGLLVCCTMHIILSVCTIDIRTAGTNFGSKI